MIDLNIKILSELERTDGLIESDIVNIENNKHIERFISPFFTVLFWNKFRNVNPTLFEKYSENIFDFLISNYSYGKGWHFFPDKRNYPTDTDDTSMIASFLVHNNRLSIREAKKIEQLIIDNKADENNFYVWIRTGENRKSDIIDPIVNVNIQDFLALLKKTKKKDLKIVENINYYISSKYYQSNSVSLWFLFNSSYISCDSNQRSEILNKLYNDNLLNIDYLSLSFLIQDAIHLLPKTIIIYKNPVINWFKHSSSKIGYKCVLLEELEKANLIKQIESIDNKRNVPNILYK